MEAIEKTNREERATPRLLIRGLAILGLLAGAVLVAYMAFTEPIPDVVATFGDHEYTRSQLSTDLAAAGSSRWGNGYDRASQRELIARLVREWARGIVDSELPAPSAVTAEALHANGGNPRWRGMADDLAFAMAIVEHIVYRINQGEEITAKERDEYWDEISSNTKYRLFTFREYFDREVDRLAEEKLQNGRAVLRKELSGYSSDPDVMHDRLVAWIVLQVHQLYEDSRSVAMAFDLMEHPEVVAQLDEYLEFTSPGWKTDPLNDLQRHTDRWMLLTNVRAENLKTTAVVLHTRLATPELQAAFDADSPTFTQLFFFGNKFEGIGIYQILHPDWKQRDHLIDTIRLGTKVPQRYLFYTSGKWW